ncbi:MAG: UTP--glucose-1-phosphate uridylyltransferase [Myxococcota bacterium]
MKASSDPRLDRTFLDAHGFDAARFDREVELIRSGQLTKESSIISQPIEPVEAVSVAERTEAVRQAGKEALSRGEVAVVVLNGGMATRFGGVVKGVVEVFDGKSFIALKAEDVRRKSERYGKSIPLVLMNSFATRAATREHIDGQGGFGLESDQILSFEQTVSVRLTPEGELFIGDDGKPSYHAPGHGDFFPCIRTSGVLGQLDKRNIKHVLFSNVDNLGATLDPVPIGHHVLSGASMTVEVTEKRKNASGKWDKGGAPAKVAGFTQIIEGFRFPPDFAQESLPDFSTNTFHFRLEALSQKVELPRHVVEKTVDGRPALQLESIACEASGLKDASGAHSFPLHLLRVSRDDAHGRFFPVKEPKDLEDARLTLKTRLEDEWSRD